MTLREKLIVAGVVFIPGSIAIFCIDEALLDLSIKANVDATVLACIGVVSAAVTVCLGFLARKILVSRTAKQSGAVSDQEN